MFLDDYSEFARVMCENTYGGVKGRLRCDNIRVRRKNVDI